MFDKTVESQENEHMPLYPQHTDDSIQRDIRITTFINSYTWQLESAVNEKNLKSLLASRINREWLSPNSI